MLSRLLISAFALAVLTLMGVQTHSQNTDTCPALVEDAINTANDNCATLSRNEACYGYQAIRATFYDNAEITTFSQPTDIVPVTTLRRIETEPANPETGDVGVAMMKLQAMLPNTLPGQSVVFVLVGDVEIESAVDPNTAASPADPISANVVTEATARAGTGTDYNVVATIAAGTTVDVDGVSSDGMWARVIIDDYMVWVERTAFGDNAEINALPIVTDTAFGAMQAFTLSTGVGNPLCEEAPASLMVQGPETAEITLNVNGADITIGSTVVFEATENNELELSVLDGSARLNDSQIILGGFAARIGIDPATQRVIGNWNETEAIADEALARFREFERLQGDLLNYVIDAPTREQIESMIDEGLLEIQNNFAEVTPEIRQELFKFDSELRNAFAEIERAGITINGDLLNIQGELDILGENLERELGDALQGELDNLGDALEGDLGDIGNLFGGGGLQPPTDGGTGGLLPPRGDSGGGGGELQPPADGGQQLPSSGGQQSPTSGGGGQQSPPSGGGGSGGQGPLGGLP